MPFKNARQRRAMFAKGGKSARTARRWARKYGSKPGGGFSKRQKAKRGRKR